MEFSKINYTMTAAGLNSEDKNPNTVIETNPNVGEELLFPITSILDESFQALQQVDICCESKEEVIRIINTILKNVGDSRRFTVRSKEEKINEVLYALTEKYYLNPGLLIDWDKCQNDILNKNLVVRFNTADKSDKNGEMQWYHAYFNSSELSDKCYLHFRMEYGDKKWWNEVLVQYPNTRWIILTAEDTDRFLPQNDSTELPLIMSCMTNDNGKCTTFTQTRKQIREGHKIFVLEFLADWFMG